jgi:Ca-activated chloride channel family protein
VAVAEEAARQGVPVYTVALGTPEGTLPDGKPVPPDTASLQAIAQTSGGEAFTAQDASGLSAVYERLGSQVAMRDEPREITGAFAGGAMALLLLGGGLSLRWFRRLI